MTVLALSRGALTAGAIGSNQAATRVAVLLQYFDPDYALAITGQKMVNESRQAGAEALAVSGRPDAAGAPANVEGIEGSEYEVKIRRVLYQWKMRYGYSLTWCILRLDHIDPNKCCDWDRLSEIERYRIMKALWRF